MGFQPFHTPDSVALYHATIELGSIKIIDHADSAIFTNRLPAYHNDEFGTPVQPGWEVKAPLRFLVIAQSRMFTSCKIPWLLNAVFDYGELN